MEHESRITEKHLMEALDMKEAGFSTAEIMEKFPQFKKGLKGYFDSLDILKEQSKKIEVDPNHFEKVLAALPNYSSGSSIISPFAGSLFFKKYGFVLSAGITLALIAIITTKNGLPNSPELAINQEDASQFTTMNSPAANDTGAPQAKMMTEPMAMRQADPIDEAVGGIKQSMSREAQDPSSDASDAKLAAYDENDISNLNKDNENI
jgi:hypothetical protein